MNYSLHISLFFYFTYIFLSFILNVSFQYIYTLLFADCFDTGSLKVSAHALKLAHAQKWCGAGRVPGVSRRLFHVWPSSITAPHVSQSETCPLLNNSPVAGQDLKMFGKDAPWRRLESMSFGVYTAEELRWETTYSAWLSPHVGYGCRQYMSKLIHQQKMRPLYLRDFYKLFKAQPVVIFYRTFCSVVAPNVVSM